MEFVSMGSKSVETSGRLASAASQTSKALYGKPLLQHLFYVGIFYIKCYAESYSV